MYRPTVRYDDIFRDYVDELFHATNLDRNQIIRAALFTAAHTQEFRQLLEPSLKGDVLIPSPTWRLDQPEYWRGSSVKTVKREDDVIAKRRGEGQGAETTRGDNGRGKTAEAHAEGESNTRRTRSVLFREAGGIKITFN